MATVADVTAAIAALGAKVDAAKASLDLLIQRVEALIAAGGVATSADLQTILDGLTSLGGKVDAIKSEEDAERP